MKSLFVSLKKYYTKPLVHNFQTMSTWGPDQEPNWNGPTERGEKLTHKFYCIRDPKGLLFNKTHTNGFAYGEKNCQRFLSETEAQEALVAWAIEHCKKNFIPSTPIWKNYVDNGYTIEYIDLDQARKLANFL